MNPLLNALRQFLYATLVVSAASMHAYAQTNDFRQTTDKALAAGSPEAVLKALDKEIYRGNLVAARKLGLMYRDGQLVPQDTAKAQKFLKIAADTNLNRIWYRYGMVDAQYELAMLTQGSNPAQAESWYRKAADLGHAPSQLALAKMYFNGAGIKRDPERALFWSSVAATSLPEAEQKEAQTLGDAAQKQLDPKQLEKTRSLLSQWKPKKAS